MNIWKRLPFLLIAIFLSWVVIFLSGRWPDMTTPEPTWDSALVFFSAILFVIYGISVFIRGGIQVLRAVAGYVGDRGIASVSAAIREDPDLEDARRSVRWAMLKEYLRRLWPGTLVMLKAFVWIAMAGCLMNVHRLL